MKPVTVAEISARRRRGSRPRADPHATAAAVVELLADPAAWARAQQAGGARVEAYYGRERMVEGYRAL